MTGTYVIGVDPGPVTGIVGLWIEEHQILRADIAQCSAGCVGRVLEGFLFVPAMSRLAVERYVVGPRSVRSNDQAAASTTRAIVEVVAAAAARWHIPCTQRSAADVKPWASDRRLLAPGADLLKGTTGMPHARDAGRHALFEAVHVKLLPDPLSARSRFCLPTCRNNVDCPCPNAPGFARVSRETST